MVCTVRTGSCLLRRERRQSCSTVPPPLRLTFNLKEEEEAGGPLRLPAGKTPFSSSSRVCVYITESLEKTPWHVSEGRSTRHSIEGSNSNVCLPTLSSSSSSLSCRLFRLQTVKRKTHTETSMYLFWRKKIVMMVTDVFSGGKKKLRERRGVFLCYKILTPAPRSRHCPEIETTTTTFIFLFWKRAKMFVVVVVCPTCVTQREAKRDHPKRRKS